MKPATLYWYVITNVPVRYSKRPLASLKLSVLSSTTKRPAASDTVSIVTKTLAISDEPSAANWVTAGPVPKLMQNEPAPPVTTAERRGQQRSQCGLDITGAGVEADLQRALAVDGQEVVPTGELPTAA